MYLPDFYFPQQSIILEMKPGRKLDLSKPLLLKKDYPQLNVKFIDQKGYRILERKFSKHIPHWEPLRVFKEDSSA